MWMIENPHESVKMPDDLPHDYVLDIAKPYLGKFISIASDWTPNNNTSETFRGYNNPNIDSADPWQFKNFLRTDGKD
jgi:homospermidine synthase